MQIYNRLEVCALIASKTAQLRTHEEHDMVVFPERVRAKYRDAVARLEGALSDMVDWANLETERGNYSGETTQAIEALRAARLAAWKQNGGEGTRPERKNGHPESNYGEAE